MGRGLVGAGDEEDEQGRDDGEEDEGEDEEGAEGGGAGLGEGEAGFESLGEGVGGQAGEAGFGGGLVGLGADEGDLGGEGIELGGHINVGAGDAAEVVADGGGDGVEFGIAGTALGEVFIGGRDNAGDVGEEFDQLREVLHEELRPHKTSLR